MGFTWGARQARATMGATVWPEPCDLCGGTFLHLHCKLTCQRCGYRRDCSDP